MKHNVVRPRHRLPALARLLALLAATTGLVIAGLDGSASPAAPALPPGSVLAPAPWAQLRAQPGDPAPGGDPTRRTLVLYDDGARPPGSGATYGAQTANLVSRAGSYRLEPVSRYRQGDAQGDTAMVYVGSGDTTPPSALLSDLAAGRVPPTLWMGGGIEGLFAAHPELAARWGWRPTGEGLRPVVTVDYAGHRLRRDPEAGIAGSQVELTTTSSAQVLATAFTDDGQESPYAVRAGRVTYLADNPFDYVDVSDRYLAASDLLLSTIAGDTPERHRALVRLEDVGPNYDPAQLRQIADYLSSAGVPFSVAVYPHYVDPQGHDNGGVPVSLWLADRPDVVAALRYMTTRGGTLIMHGVTHQYAARSNPYSGVSAADFEFYLAHVDTADYVRLDGPVPEDSEAWATERIDQGRGEFERVRLPSPAIFEFPHYTASAADYTAVDKIFGVRYDQGTYYAEPGSRSDSMYQQYFPWMVRDTYGSVVIPENLGNIAPETYNHNVARTPTDLIRAADDMRVVRDGVASFFYHPYLGVDRLRETVEGIRALGYRFTTVDEVISGTRDFSPMSSPLSGPAAANPR